MSGKLSEVVIFGDSHVVRMEKVLGFNKPEGISFHGVSGLKLCDFGRHMESLTIFKLVVVLLGGNDASQHPRKQEDEPEDACVIVKRMKSFADLLLEKGVQEVIICEILPREAYPASFFYLNQVLAKKFRSHFLPWVHSPEHRSGMDRVHFRDYDYVVLFGEITARLLKHKA